MAKVKTVNQKTLVANIMTVGGVNKENATGIFNIFTNAWNTDRIGLLKAVDSGIVVARKRVAPTKKTTVKTKTVKTKALVPAKKKLVAKKTPTLVGKVKTKGKKKLKSKKAKSTIPVVLKKSNRTQVSA